MLLTCDNKPTVQYVDRGWCTYRNPRTPKWPRVTETTYSR